MKTNWREVLAWQLVPKLNHIERLYVLRTGRLPQDKFHALGLNLHNWGRYRHSLVHNVYIAADVLRYIVEIQEGEDVAHYSIYYSDLIEEGINVFDFEEVINFAIGEGPEDISENENLEELIEDEGVNIIPLN